jgi:hypothetical protein
VQSTAHFSRSSAAARTVLSALAQLRAASGMTVTAVASRPASASARPILA